MLDNLTTKPYSVSEEIWKAWLEFRQTYNSKLRTRAEKYDPYKHLPKAFLEKLKHLPLDETHSISDLEAVENGIARLSEEGYIMYDYDKLHAMRGYQKAKKVYIDDPLDALIKDAEKREAKMK